MTIGGQAKSDDKKLQRLRKKKDYCQTQQEKMKLFIRKIRDGEIDEDWTTEWWYCNKIQGYPTPPDGQRAKRGYEHEPHSDFQNQVRDGFDTQKFNKEYALKRLETARQNYKDKYQQVKQEIQELESSGWE